MCSSDLRPLNIKCRAAIEALAAVGRQHGNLVFSLGSGYDGKSGVGIIHGITVGGPTLHPDTSRIGLGIGKGPRSDARGVGQACRGV